MAEEDARKQKTLTPHPLREAGGGRGEGEEAEMTLQQTEALPLPATKSCGVVGTQPVLGFF